MSDYKIMGRATNENKNSANNSSNSNNSNNTIISSNPASTDANSSNYSSMGSLNNTNTTNSTNSYVSSESSDIANFVGPKDYNYTVNDDSIAKVETVKKRITRIRETINNINSSVNNLNQQGGWVGEAATMYVASVNKAASDSSNCIDVIETEFNKYESNLNQSLENEQSRTRRINNI